MTARAKSELLVVGSGCPLLPGRAWSCFLLEGRILLEVPPMVPRRLYELGVNPLDIEVIAISHLHGDHFAGLPFLLLEYDAVTQRTAPLTIVGPCGTAARIEALFELYFPGWERSQTRKYPCVFKELSDGEAFSVAGVQLRAFEVNHGLAPGQALGFRIEGSSSVIGFSGDTSYTERLLDIAKDVDLFIVDCTFADRVPGATHLSFDEICELRAVLPESTEIVLTHQGACLPNNLLLRVRVPYDGELLQCKSSG